MDRCFVCNVIVLNYHIGDCKELEIFSTLYGPYNRLAGHIGNKKICRNCVKDLMNLFEEEENRQAGWT